MALSKQTISMPAASTGEPPPAERTDETVRLPPPPAAQGRGVNSPIARRLNYFWLLVIIAIIVGGIASADSHHHDLWHSWRGPLIIVLSLAFIAWYLLGISDFAHIGRHRPLPPRVWIVWLGTGFAITAALLVLDHSFAALTYALIGASMFVPGRWAVFPIGIALLLNVWANGLLSPPPPGKDWGDNFANIFDVMLSLGIVYAVTAVLRERIQRERLLEELSEANRRLRLAVARDVEMATLRERNRVAREMHDSLGHALVSIAIKLEATRLLSDIDAPRAVAELEETTTLVRSTMTDLRHSLAGLRPAALEEQPLCRALADLAHEMGGRAGVEVTCTIDERVDMLERCTQETLYRVGQEALTNVAKHARASRVNLSLCRDDTGITLEVGDDGVGLGAAQRTESARYGVQGMRERVEALGGMLTIGPRPERGTLVRAWLPAAIGS
jgi:signal transduction histidine kinase